MNDEHIPNWLMAGVIGYVLGLWSMCVLVFFMVRSMS
jgi:hypothetical protein